MRIISIVCSFLFYIQSIDAAQVVIKGRNVEYAGECLTFNIYENFITSDEKKLVTVTPDLKGEFSFQLNLQETEYIFAHVGEYFLYMYLEPGKSYEIDLPRKKSKTPDEKLNP